ncbi:MAG: hypothetical protein JSV54_05255 [Chloroflexota bacterium]|nr:MAG: hypothetical protein JSV54_05255 [Chloroflexota bacterium]
MRTWNEEVHVPDAGESDLDRLIGNRHEKAEGRCIYTPFSVNGCNYLG